MAKEYVQTRQALTHDDNPLTPPKAKGEWTLNSWRLGGPPDDQGLVLVWEREIKKG